MKIKTTTGNHFTPVRMAIINKATNKVLERMWRKGNPSALLVGMQTGAATLENTTAFPPKTTNTTAFRPGNSTAGIVSKNLETPIQKNLCTPVFLAA